MRVLPCVRGWRVQSASERELRERVWVLREVQCSVLELAVRGAAVLEDAGPRLPELHSMLDGAVSGFTVLHFEQPCMRGLYDV